MKNLCSIVFSGLIVLGSLSGCGQGKKVIENIELNSAIVDQALWVEMDAQLAPTQFVLPSIVLPLLDPNQPSRKLGELQTYPDHIFVRVNVTEAARVALVDGTRLPNGTRIPIALNDAKIIGIPVANSGSMVYVALLDQQIMIGAALNVRDIEPSAHALNVFLPVQISDSISGVGGMYFGSQSGVGIFAVKSGMPQLQSESKLALKSSSMKRIFARKSRPMVIDPSELTQKKIERFKRKTRDLRGLVSVE
jgi:hypothetical protein